MKIGAIFSPAVQRHFDHDYACKRYREAGIECLDYSLYGVYAIPSEIFSSSRNEWTKEFAERKKIIEGNGLFVNQTHGTYPTNYLSFRDSDWKSKYMKETELDLFKKQIEVASILGAKYIVIHPINHCKNDIEWEENRLLNLDAFSRLEPILREFNVQLGVENMFEHDPVRRRFCKTGCSTPEDMIDLIDTLNASLSSDRFVACLDTGHMLIQSISPDKAVKKLGSRLKLLHVQDNVALSDDHCAPGIGFTDWKAFALALKEVGYDGAFSVEAGLDQPAIIDKELIFDYIEYTAKASRRVIELAEVK